MVVMKHISRFIAVITLLSSAPVLCAQEAESKSSISFSWGVEVPVGDGNFTSKATFMTPKLGYEYLFASEFSIGGSIGVSHSDEKMLYEGMFDNSFVTTTPHRKLTLVPIQADFRYFPLRTSKSAFQPYVGLSAGVQYAKFYITADVINTSGRSNWAEVITPNAGLRYQPDEKRIYMDLRAHWQHSGNGWDLADGNKSQQNVGVRLGFGLSF